MKSISTLLYILVLHLTTLHASELIVGAERGNQYLSRLHNQRVAVVVNPSSKVKNIHLIDYLLKNNINLKRIFAPEHGLRGDSDAGEHVGNYIDQKTGLPVVSLYGDNKKPQNKYLQDLDIIIFDIQDVGARFYTYISTMHYAMEAAFENGVKFIVLDRPNPNGHYVDGPVLKKEFKSFVGMHPIPVVHGLTVGELALMINSEGWLKDRIQGDLEVVPVKDYTHNTPYSLPIAPSPNLPNDNAINLYPSLCFFEPTVISVGRGTYSPFQIIGSPNIKGDFSFTPKRIEGMSKWPKHQDKTCYGENLRMNKRLNQIDLSYLLNFYNETPKDFFSNRRFFNLLAGNQELLAQIELGFSEEMIKASWKIELDKYRRLRSKYLLYP